MFIQRSCGIFYLIAKSLLRHPKKIVLITWVLSCKFYIFKMDFRRLQQFHFTVYSIMNMITAFSILLQLHGILLSFTYIRFYLSGSTRRSHFEIEFGKNSQIRIRFKGKSIPPCRAGPPSHVHMTNFHLT